MKDINLRQDAPSQVSQVNPEKISEEIKKLQDVISITFANCIV